MESCANCGADVLEGAPFCPHCGVPTGEQTPSPAVATEGAELTHDWIWCEIEWIRSFRGSEFDARPLTPGAANSLPRSPVFRWREDHPPPETNADARQAHEDLVGMLVTAGWEPVGSADPWYVERFRRPATRELVQLRVERPGRSVAARLGIAALTLGSLAAIVFAMLVVLGYFGR